MGKGFYELKIMLNNGHILSLEGTIEKLNEQTPKKELEKCLAYLKDTCTCVLTYQQVSSSRLVMKIKAELPNGRLNQELRNEAKETLQKIAELFQKMNFFAQVVHIKRGYLEVHRVSDREEQGLKDYLKILGFKEVKK